MTKNVNYEVDVLKLLAGQIKNLEDSHAWNRWLTKCLAQESLNELINFRYGIQMGMATAQRKGLVNEKLAETYARWIGSIDKTLRRIITKRSKIARHDKNKPLKRDRDAEFERFLRKQSY